ncbi:hypothetical protein QWY97_06480 [Vibrio cortegadensis]|uniref:hypothetical protein n=1 Tax=Vibrio cortegadensis TaxID=1328770 RepID=UPI0021C291D5|nr:hypothetical protein [Vibrio cortegadensis]MDN3696999.1 hypothetical protein [Vibrio cortegadensis]
MLTIVDAKNPQWVNVEKTRLDMDVQFTEFEEYVPFSASVNADTKYGLALYQRAINGEFGVVIPYVKPVINVAEVETAWQVAELETVEFALKPYAEDMQIPDQYSELRKTTNTEENYYKLLMDRKLLVEYLQQSDFPECGRPVLSELSNT